MALRASALALATTACCGVATSPALAVSKSEKKQNTAIKKNTSSIKKTRSSASRAASDAKKARSAAKKVDTKAGSALLAAIKAGNDAATAQQGVNTINTAVVPAAIKGLTDLQNGLLALKSGLEAAGAGLQKLATFTASDEYGVVSISVGGNPVGGCFYESANIPDNLQDAIVSGTCNVSPAQAAGAISINAGIRSNESDGAATGEPAGVAGIVSYSLDSADLAAGGAQTLKGFGQTAPNADVGGAPARVIQLKSAPTSTTETSFAFAPISTDNFVDLATTANGFAGSGAPTLPAASSPANLRTIKFTVRFNDLSTNAAADPSS